MNNQTPTELQTKLSIIQLLAHTGNLSLIKETYDWVTEVSEGAKAIQESDNVTQLVLFPRD